MGIAKLVLDAGTPEPVVRTALSILKLVVSGTCQESAASLLTEEVRALRQRVADLQRVRWRGNPGAGRSVASSTAAGAERKDAQGASLVERAVIHLQREYLDPTLTLQSVAKALGCNPRYLTTRFTRIVGERMHTYVITLRVSNACRLLTGTDLLVKEVAYASGFARTGRLTSAFRRHVGVSPSEYRRIFSGS